MDLAPFIVCPETLGPLKRVDEGFWSERAQRLYPSRQGLVFMGYPTRDATMIRSTMEEERVWQGTGEAASQNLAYLRASVDGGVDLINTLQRYLPETEGQPRAMELGCGNGWVSWLLAEAGFDTWMCDFEANSLVTGLNLEHPNLGEGKRFVADARYAPCADGALDLVLLKEFVHHVEDHRPLFCEAARMLRAGGIVVLREPVMCLWRKLYELRHPDPHEGHHITWPDSYLRAIRRAGFEVVYQSQIYSDDANRRRLTAWLKERAEASIDEANPSGSWLAKLQLRLFGGAQLVVIARKVRDLPRAERPPMVAIDPATLVVDDEEVAGYAEFPVVLADAARRLDHVPAGDPA